MIVVIDAKENCVWGLGKTEDEAWADSREEIAGKIPVVRPDISALTTAQLSPDADLDADGESMWQWVVQDTAPANSEAVKQMGLFS
ncbi:hypothetical protein PHACT_12785 [Pseudohongiella acticola]|uniref:Uncharacterized protein n=1 Tax=Pseudohongiella acticola TaxID=1524254 RepID=A0A1E8CGB3_9GAMM|nr:hypothetical protein [Pseudohongiella acticola]OFE11426.1 hypothetical protein PHACT_12785 [Pseudohongiella acticola]